MGKDIVQKFGDPAIVRVKRVFVGHKAPQMKMWRVEVLERGHWEMYGQWPNKYKAYGQAKELYDDRREKDSDL